MEKKRRAGLQVEMEKEESDSTSVDASTVIEKHELDISAEELKELQCLDPTLSEVRSAVKCHESKEGAGFFYKDTNNDVLQKIDTEY